MGVFKARMARHSLEDWSQWAVMRDLQMTLHCVAEKQRIQH
jgi:hypothetical protein